VLLAGRSLQITKGERPFPAPQYKFMPKIRKYITVDEDQITAAPEVEDYSEPKVVAQQEDVAGDSSPLLEVEYVFPPDRPEEPVVPLMTQEIANLEVVRVINLLVDVIKYAVKRKRFDYRSMEIIVLRLESANRLVRAIKSITPQ